MRAFPRKVRFTLFVVILGLLLADIWWLAQRDSPEHKLFELSLTSEGIVVQHPDRLPLFDPANQQWIVNGRAEKSIAPHLDDTGHGPDGGGKAIVVRLPEGAGIKVFSKALLALGREGICRVAVYGGADPKISATEAELPIFRVVWVQDERGLRQPCQSR